jgi:hypothetical protein
VGGVLTPRSAIVFLDLRAMDVNREKRRANRINAHRGTCRRTPEVMSGTV